MPQSTTNRMNVKLFFEAVLVSVFVVAAGGARAHAQNHLSNPLFVDPATQDFSRNPKLLQRIRSGPHGYFRFINIIFSQEVCRRFEHLLTDAPSLNLHGDAHIEQYAVTDLGRGLTDFDDSSTGPGIIDLVRFGVSLNLACSANHWQKLQRGMYQKFLDGYVAALQDPTISAPEPKLIQRIRSKFKIDRVSYFEWIDSIMEPMPQQESDSLLTAMKPYVENMFAENPRLNKNFFQVVKTGYLRMGIGSALDIKYLVRVQGPSDAPYDDLVLECKQVRDLRGIPCINSGPNVDPFRVLLGQARIAYQPFHHLGYFRFKGYNFWVHSWVDNYKEVKIGKSFASPEDLAEVAYDVGVQLGKGHVKHIGAPFDLQLRRQQLRMVQEHQAEIIQACQELTELTVAAWERFVDKLVKK